MSELELRALRRGKSVLRVRPTAVGKALPTPVLYEGLTDVDLPSSTALSSDAFKLRLRDTAGKLHVFPDATVASAYEEVRGEERDELLERHWPAA